MGGALKIMKKNCYIVTSAMMTKTAPEKSIERWMQTLHTVDSINARDKNAEIFIIDTGFKKLPQWTYDHWSKNVKILDWQDHKKVAAIEKESKRQSDLLVPKYIFNEKYSEEDKRKFIWHGYIKNITESWAIQEFFKGHDLKKYEKVFKISGRYVFGEQFNIENYDNKFTFKKQATLKDGTVSLSSITWCFQGSHFLEFKEKWDNTNNYLLNCWNNGITKDLESSLWHGFGKSEKERQITYIEKLGIIGIINSFDTPVIQVVGQ